MSNKWTHAELAAAQKAGNWALLWQQAMPLVKLALRRLKLRDKDNREEFEQQGMLIAGEAIRTWKPIECAFSTFVVRRVAGDLSNYALNARGGIGSYKQRPKIVGLGDERADGRGADAESEDADDDGTIEAALTYAGIVMPGGQFDGDGCTPEGFGDPSDVADVGAREAVRGVLQHLAEEEIELVSTVFGLGGGRAQTLGEYASARNIPYRTAKWRWAKIKKTLAPYLKNFRD